jgi:twinkle protein
LIKFDSSRLLQCIFDAAPYVPSGIINKEDLWKALENYNSAQSVPYPDCLNGVNTKLKGMRAGEIALFISGTGSGKSTVLREIMLHLLTTTKDKIGVVSLEESPAETARKLAGMVLTRNPAKEEIPLEDLKVGFDTVFGDDRVVLLDHQGSINDNSIVDQLEYMCLVGCRYLFIDHITILVSEGVEHLTGNEAQDKVMNDLLRLVKRHPVWIGLVSHLRKAPNTKKSFEEGQLPSIDDIRGSGSIKQISFDIISFSRNLTADSEAERNTIKMRVLKSRYTGLTGNVKGAHYIYDTGRLVESKMDVEEFVTL